MTFFNIFSNKKEDSEEEKPKIKILIDNREKNSLVPSELIRLNQKIEFTQLQIGDYQLGNTIIERKTLSDLKSSIINKRIFDQINQLTSNEEISPLLIIELGDEDIYQGIIHENALRGFFLSLATNNKIPFIFSQNEKDTAKYLSVLANRKENKEFSLRPSRVLKTQEERQQFILEGFPNIGPVKAKALLEKFKTLNAIFNASEEELKEILGKQTNDFLNLLD